MERARDTGVNMGITADIGGAMDEGDSPLELTINNQTFYLTDSEPMGVVAEVIRNDMGTSLGIMVYDDITKQIHRFKSSQVVVRPDGNVTILPSWFRKSREILHNIEPMEMAIPDLKRAKKRDVTLSPEAIAMATGTAPPEVQHYIDDVVILRSKLIGKLHVLVEKRESTQAQLKEISSPGLFDRTPIADRQLMIATLKRSLRLNEHTINAMHDFLVRLEGSPIFPRDMSYRALFKDIPP